MSHSNTVTNSNSREYDRVTACQCNTLFNGIDDLIYIHVTGNNFIIRADNTDHRLCDFLICHTECMKQRTLRCALYTLAYCVTIHLNYLPLN